MAMRREPYRPCKICYCDMGSRYGDADGLDRLVQCPCKCKGSMGWVHLDCLTKWLNASTSTYCEICNHQYNFKILRRSGSLMLTKFVMLLVVVLSICAGPNVGLWVGNSIVEYILWFIFKVLLASLFVDWGFMKIGIQTEMGKSVIALDLKT